MSFLSKLELDGEIYNVLHCKYSFTQDTDNAGKPRNTIHGGEIELTVESRGNSTFIDWMLSDSKSKDGVIIFYRRDAMSKLQEVKFEKGYCIAFTEEFDAVNDQPMQITALILAKKIDIANISYENSWKM